jgi:hypothetical protein
MKKSKDLERLEEDSEWVTQNYDRLKKYQGKVVAVKNKDIIAVSENLDKRKKKNQHACYLKLFRRRMFRLYSKGN